MDEEATGSTEPQISDSKVDSSVDVVRVEIADTPFSCALRFTIASVPDHRASIMMIADVGFRSIYSGGQETEDFLERELNALKEERMEQPVRSINDTCVSAADSTTPNNWSGDLVEPQSSTSVSEEIEVKPEPTECHVEPSKKKVSGSINNLSPLQI